MRDLRIDLLRGYALLSILVNHAQQLAGMYYFAPTIKHLFPGFSDSAEMFVFLSGLSSGLAYGRRFQSDPSSSMQKILNRIGALYLMHLLSIAVIVVLYGLFFHNPFPSLPVDDLESLLVSPRAWLGVLLLQIQPNYTNILPLYMVLLALTPLALLLLKNRAGLALLGSALVYLGFALADRLDPDVVPSPLHRWSFYPGCWQFLFFLGLWFGEQRAQGRWIDWKPPGFLTLIAWAIIATSVGLRILIWKTGDYSLLEWIPFNRKQTMEPTLVIHFLALIVLVIRYSSATSPWLEGRLAGLLVAVGQRSLECFVVGTVLSFFAAFAALADHSRLLHVILNAASVIAVTLMAHLLSRHARSIAVSR